MLLAKTLDLLPILHVIETRAVCGTRESTIEYPASPTSVEMVQNKLIVRLVPRWMENYS
jgi:hypothetical protein